MSELVYRAIIEAPGDGVQATCGGGCGWHGAWYETAPIEECMLTPGDESPVGRCPECEALAYVDKVESRPAPAAPS